MDRRQFTLAALAGLAASSSANAERVRRLTSDPFKLGVASGDPSTTGFVIWTRLVGDELDERPVSVTWEVAEDEAFKRVVRSGRVNAEAQWAHSVHVEVDGLRPGRYYWYRF